MKLDIKSSFFRNTLLLITLTLLLVLAWSAEAAISFARAVNYPVGQSGNVVRNIAVGDFNGDGKLDMAVPNSTDNDVAILLGNDYGTFTPAGAYTTDTGIGGPSPRFIAVADLNEDGKLDLAVANNGNSNVVILLGNGDGTFQLPVGYGVGTNPFSIAVGDYNRDGHLDLAVANSGSANVSILFGNGNGTFGAAVNYAAGTTPYSVVAGDFDGDGDLDLAVANRINPGGTVSILLNNGSGIFGAPASYGTGVNSRSVTIGDFNRDGQLDLAVANEGSFNVSILLGNGNGTFQAAVNYSSGSAPRFVTTADFNGDAILDLAVTDGNDNFVYVLQGNNNGTFQVAVPFMVGRRPDGVAAADFNGDGKPDVVTANTNSNSDTFGIWNVSVLLNTTTFDPTGSLTTKMDYPVGTNPNAIATGDFNRDGKPDLVAVNFNSGNVSYLQGVGDGTFAAAVNYSAGTYPYWVTAGDFNRDGNLDLAVANFGLAGTVSILLGNGDGTFGAPSSFGAGAYPVFIISADFDRDGNPDLAVANAGSDDTALLLGNGDGTFQAALFYNVGATPYAIAVDDFDRDGKLDLAVANYYSFSVSILLGNGDGTFNSPADFGTGYNPIALITGDFNRDGKVDLAVANYWSGNVSLLAGMGDGNFLAPVNFKVGANPSGIAASDFYRDGKLDLAVSCESAHKVFVLSGKGDGTFLPATSFATANRPAGVVNGDFDGDGKIDLATANWAANNVSVLLNWKDTVTTPTTPAGINLNGTLKDKGVPGMSYGFSTGGSVNSLGHPVEYQFDWKGDGSDLSAWGLPTKSNAWDVLGTYNVRARARCATHPEVVSAWSSALTIDIGGPTITGLLIEAGATYTKKTTVEITYTASPSATHVRISIGGAWGAWLLLPVGPPHNVSLGTVNGLRDVYAQVKDADGRISATAWDQILLDTMAPLGVVKINGGNTTVLSGGATTTVRAHLAMFDATMPGAQVRVKPNATFSDPADNVLWVNFDAVTNTGIDVTLSGTGTKTVYAQFMDGVGIKSPIYSTTISIPTTGGTPWPGPSAVTVSNVQLNDGKLYTISPTVKLTYDVSVSTNIKVHYLYTSGTGTVWSAWETPTVTAGKVTKFVTLSGTNGLRQVYVQLMETTGGVNPGAMTDPNFASITLDTVAPNALIAINHGATSIRRFNTDTNYLILTILATDTASGMDKIALFQTGTLPSTTVPPSADSPDWFDYTPTMDSFGLDTRTTDTKSVYVWLKDKAGKVSSLKVATVSVVP